MRLTEETLRTETAEDAKTIAELAEQLSKAKLEIDELKEHDIFCSFFHAFHNLLYSSSYPQRVIYSKIAFIRDQGRILMLYYHFLIL